MFVISVEINQKSNFKQIICKGIKVQKYYKIGRIMVRMAEKIIVKYALVEQNVLKQSHPKKSMLGLIELPYFLY